MLLAHMAAVERTLLQIAQIPANTGHSLHKGTPREAFISEFLSNHLSERVAIGSGEIIDHNSKPNEARNQFDIVIYRREYPRLAMGGGINAFLVESVVATIEVKSLLDKAGMRQAMSAAKQIKRLSPSLSCSFSTGYQPPSVFNYIVAYDGPAAMNTVAGWLPDITAEIGVAYPELPADNHARLQTASPALDAVFVLGKGFLQYLNQAIGFGPVPEIVKEHPDMRWALSNCETGSLLLFFLQLTQAVSGVSGSWLNPDPYLADFKVSNLAHASGLPDISPLLGGQWDTGV